MSGTHPIDFECAACGAQPGASCVGVRGNLRKALHRARGTKKDAAPRYVGHGLGTESVIENKLVGAVVAWIHHHDAIAVVKTQVPVGAYRADVIIEARGRLLAVECDGAAFHTSDDAVAHDRRRDRYFATQDIFVMRFTGSEIARDPRQCAAQIGRWIVGAK